MFSNLLALLILLKLVKKSLLFAPKIVLIFLIFFLQKNSILVD